MDNLLLKKVISKQSIDKNLDKLKYGVLHSQYGFSDGVSIVMEQVEHAMMRHLNIPKENIYYLVGKSKRNAPEIVANEIIWDHNPINRYAINNYQKGLNKIQHSAIEILINKSKRLIRNFIKKNKIDVIIAHNTSHPVNFVLAAALSRYYKEEIEAGRKVPQYILWWHDSHLERPQFQNPAQTIEPYVDECFPGPFVDKIVYINSIQAKTSKKYFKMLNNKYKGIRKRTRKNNVFIYNTTETFISEYEDLPALRFDFFVNQFLDDYKINPLLRREGLEVDDVLFVLQQTRMVERKRIDFALEYLFELYEEAKRKKQFRGIYFLVSGEDSRDGSKQEIKKLHEKLSKEYKTNKIFLAFTDEVNSEIPFKSYPKVFASLGGMGTYFSEIEGFGNNLLENLASGLVTVIYKYPVYKTDIEQFGFKVLSTNKFVVTPKLIDETLNILKDEKIKAKWVNKNLKILKKHLSHKTIADKLEKIIDKKPK